jgi:hypothetical protein
LKQAIGEEKVIKWLMENGLDKALEQLVFAWPEIKKEPRFIQWMNDLQ